MVGTDPGSRLEWCSFVRSGARVENILIMVYASTTAGQREEGLWCCGVEDAGSCIAEPREALELRA